MAFGGEMHDVSIRSSRSKASMRRVVADVGLQEAIVGIVLDLPQRVEIAGIGQLVDIDDVVAGRLPTRCRHTALPMKPAPPVTRIFVNSSSPN